MRLRRSSVDFIRQNNVGENRPLHEYANAFPRDPIFFNDFGSRDVRRHQVRRELNALEIEVQHLGDGRDQQRLGQTGHASDDRMPAGQHRDHHLIDDLVLADDDLTNLVIDSL